jgi:hypothetical protein
MKLKSVRPAAFSVAMCLLIIVPSRDSAAQGALAIATFERAEEAYARGDLQSAVSLVNEAEQLLGRANAPMLHLRILSRHRLLQGDANYPYELLAAVRADCRAYQMSFGDDQARLDYTRELLPLCESLRSYPADRAAYDAHRTQQREQAERARREALDRVEQERQRHAREEEQARVMRIAEIDRVLSISPYDHVPLGLAVSALFGAGCYAVSVYGVGSAEETEDLFLTGLAYVGAIAACGLTALSLLGTVVAIGETKSQHRALREERAVLVGPTAVNGPRGPSAGLALTIRF